MSNYFEKGQGNKKGSKIFNGANLIAFLTVLIILFSAIFVTLAVFTNEKKASGNIKVGSIEVETNFDSATNFVEGSPIANNLSISVPSGSSHAYIRVKLEYTTSDDSKQNLCDILNALKIETYSDENIAWRYHKGFYYLVSASDSNQLYKETRSKDSASTYKFANEIIFPYLNNFIIESNFADLSGYEAFSYGDSVRIATGASDFANIKCTFVSEAVQSENVDNAFNKAPEIFNNIFEEEDVSDKCVVVFKTPNDSDEILSFVVDKGTSIALPDSIRSDYTFLGWMSKSGLSEEIVTTDDGHKLYNAGTSIQINENLIFIADESISYNKNNEVFIVSYNSNGGTAMQNSTVVYGKPYGGAISSRVPEKESFAFRGWYLDEGLTTRIYETTYVNTYGNHTLYAKWTPMSYTFEFNGNGATSGGVSSIDIVFGNSATLPANNYAKKHYSFLGWAYVTDSDEVHLADKATIALNNTFVEGARAKGADISNYTITLYALWKANDYVVHFSTGGGSTHDDITVTYGKTYGLNSEFPIPTRNGFSFTGWYTNRNFVGEQVSKLSIVGACGETITESGEITLYARWATKTYQIYFEANGGSPVMAISRVYGTTYGELEESTRVGYQFLGWFASKDFSGSAVTADMLVPVGDHTLYAKWSAITYTITFDGNGGSGSMAPQTFTYDISGKLSKNAFILAGYSFMGWSKEKGGEVDYADEATIYNLFKLGGKTLGLYAVWNVNIYTITYEHPNGVRVDNPTTYNINTPTFVLNNPTRAGYEFSGWTGSGIDGISKVVEIAKGSTGNKVFTSMWEAQVYRITYDFNGGTLINSSVIYSQTYTYMDEIKLPNANEMIYYGYNFSGWKVVKGASDDNNWVDTTLITIPANTFYGDVTLQAQWTIRTYYIQYYDGKLPLSPIEEYTINNTIVLRDYSKSGYNFIGWKLDSETMQGSFSPNAIYSGTLESGNYGDIKLIAVYDLITYTITYDFNGSTPTTTAYTTSYTVETASIVLPNVNGKYGYVFKGYKQTIASGNNFGTTATFMPNTYDNSYYGNAKFQAQFNALVYEISYNGNGATSGTMANTKHSYNNLAFNGYTDTQLRKNAFTRTGYSFAGWAVSETSKTITYKDEASVINLTAVDGQVITLFAVWTPLTYTITYNINGGVIVTSSYTSSYTIETQIALPKAEKNGYTFSGWKASSAVGNWDTSEVLNDSTLQKYGNVTLVAQYSAFTYKVIVEGNGGTFTIGSETGLKTKTISGKAIGDTIKVENMAYTGYNFIGWVINGSSQISLSDTTPIVSTITIAGDAKTEADTSTTFTARWTPITYTVVYDANGGESGTMTSSVHTYDVTKALNKNEYGRIGYTFGGWTYDGKTYANQANVVNLTSVNGATVKMTAIWNAITYYISFDANGGSGTMSRLTATYGKAITLTANAFTRSGYGFSGWLLSQANTTVDFANGASVSNLASEQGKVVILYACWGTSSYTITYNVNGGAIASASGDYTPQGSYTYETQIILPEMYSASGNFSGWEISSSTDVGSWKAGFTYGSGVLGAGNYGNVTLVAQYGVTKYNVLIKPNGGYRVIDGANNYNDWVQDGLNGTTFTIETITRTGYTLNGFIINGSGAVTKSGSTFTFTFSTANATLTADWVANNFGLTINPNGGLYNNSTSNTSITKTIGTVVVLDTPTKVGYTFSGWTLSGGGTLVDNQYTFGSSAGVVTAKWTANQFTFIYNGNGATSGTMENTIVTYGTNATLRANAFVRNGYTFASWNTKADGTGSTLAGGATVTTYTTEPNATINLYAVWNIVTYTLTLNDHNSNTQKIEFTIIDSIELPNSVKTGSTFLGWVVTTASGNWVKNAVFQSGLLTPGYYGNATMSDSFSDSCYSLKVYLNGAEYLNASKIVTSDFSVSGSYGDTYTLSIPSLAGKVFDGWQLSGYGSLNGNVFTFGTGNASLMAQFSTLEITVSFDSNGGDEVESKAIIYGSAYGALPSPYKIGYNFVGWFDANADGNGTGNQIQSTTIMNKTANHTLYAKWTPITYSIVYNGNTSISGSTAKSTHTYDVAKNLTANGFVKPNYTFVSWNTKADGTGVTYADKASVKNLAVVDGAEFTLYAIWTAGGYTVKYNSNGGSGTMADSVFKYDEPHYLSKNTFTKASNSFIGWSLSASGAVAYADESQVVNLTISGGVVNLYAIWGENTVNVAFSYNNATGGNTTTSKVVIYEQSYGTLPAPTKSGFEFSGWFLESTFTTQITTTSIVTTKDSHILYAKWLTTSISLLYIDASTFYLYNNKLYAFNDTITHYHCTNSEHTGTNDYTDSTIPTGVCYSNYHPGYSYHPGSWISGSNSTTSSTCGTCGGSGKTGGGTSTYNCSKCSGSGNITTKGSHCYVTTWISGSGATAKYKCTYCGNTASGVVPPSGGTCDKNIQTSSCSNCGGSGKITVSNGGTTCSTCKGSGTVSNTTTTSGHYSCCGGSGSGCCYVSASTTTYNHQFEESYYTYSYVNFYDSTDKITLTSKLTKASGYYYEGYGFLNIGDVITVNGIRYKLVEHGRAETFEEESSGDGK